MYKEKETISNQHHEIKYFANKMKVSLSDVYKAKKLLKTNNRKILEDYFNNKNNSLIIRIYKKLLLFLNKIINYVKN